MGSVFEVPTFETAQELIEYVSPLNAFWSQGRYIFRGQPSEYYKLTPSICRRGVGSFAHGEPNRIFNPSTAGQVSFEIEVLKRFLHGCDRSGLVVPGYSEEIKRKLSEEPQNIVSVGALWPPSKLYEIMAVAQHYDVPTRLLDWTERSFVACYFAASSASFEYDDRELIAIWALDITYSKSWETVKLISTPGGTSRNQAAQSGLFTTHNISGYSSNDLYQPEALEDVEEIYSVNGSSMPLIKMTLPLEEAPALLSLCSKFGVDGSTLFPGYHGVAKAVRNWANMTVGVRPSQALKDEIMASQYDRYDDYRYR
jgi:hypothetical protein